MGNRFQALQVDDDDDCADAGAGRCTSAGTLARPPSGVPDAWGSREETDTGQAGDGAVRSSSAAPRAQQRSHVGRSASVEPPDYMDDAFPGAGKRRAAAALGAAAGPAV